MIHTPNRTLQSFERYQRAMREAILRGRHDLVRELRPNSFIDPTQTEASAEMIEAVLGISRGNGLPPEEHMTHKRRSPLAQALRTFASLASRPVVILGGVVAAIVGVVIYIVGFGG